MLYFGMGGSAPQTQVNTAVRALPNSWYTSQAMYDLERKAIFSRKWLLITHKVRLTRPLEYLRYEAAGFQFILGTDVNGNIRGFRNTCTTCGQLVLTDLTGSASMFTCGKHGIHRDHCKVPAYNNLSSIHVHVDHNGFLWVNLDPKSIPEISWEQDFAGIDTQERFAEFNFDEYTFDHEWEMTGPYNWKILADNYNECYHCETTHPDLKENADLETYKVTTRDEVILHHVKGKPNSPGEKGFKVHPTYYFPTTSMNVSPHFLFMQRFVPHAPVSSTMRYEVYRHRDASEEEFQSISDMYKRVMSEDKALCEAAQQNINAGIFINGEMHPVKEQGPLFFQSRCRDIVKEFHSRQQAATTKAASFQRQQESYHYIQLCRANLEFTARLLFSTLRNALIGGPIPNVVYYPPNM